MLALVSTKMQMFVEVDGNLPHQVSQASHMSPVSQSQCQTRGKQQNSKTDYTLLRLHVISGRIFYYYVKYYMMND